ncbi:MAG: phosphate ABC transporter substrate-binding protein [Hyphomicrobium sp.]|nr:phosphate ABC transporter substrate-binding protein [Hyphomicrobium sp.]
MLSKLFTTGALIFVALSTPVIAADDKIVITGSSTVAPLITEIGKRFEEKNPGVRVDVQTGGSSRGINDARSGLADIGMASRALKKDESDLKAYTIARDGIGVVLNSANTVSTLTDQQIVDIYTGKISDWSAVGGTQGPITVVNKAEGRSTLELFLHFFKLKASDIKAHVVIGDNQQGIKTVAGNPNAIGYVSVGTAEFEAGQGTPIKLLGMGGVAASVENVRNGSFPLARPLNLVTSKEPTGMTKLFIDYTQSADTHDLVKEQFFVPNGP